MKLIHFGCSFAVGNGVPHYVKGLPSDIAPRVHRFAGSERRETQKDFEFKIRAPYTCGNYLADKLKLGFQKIAMNGGSNEMIFRRLIETNLKNSFVLIGLTTDNRREGLTDRRNRSHWHTWKIVGPGQDVGYKDVMFSPWKDEYLPAIIEECQIRTLTQIIYMQNYLKNNNVPYLIFNALHNGFDTPHTSEAQELLNKVDEQNFFQLRATHEETQHGWCLTNGLCVSENDEHPAIDGHCAWGLKMLNMTKSILEAHDADR